MTAEQNKLAYQNGAAQPKPVLAAFCDGNYIKGIQSTRRGSSIGTKQMTDNAPVLTLGQKCYRSFKSSSPHYLEMQPAGVEELTGRIKNITR